MSNREEALRDAGAKSFVHDPEIERHWYGSRFVGLGIVELAIHHDGDGNKASLAFVGNLNQGEGTGPLVGIFARLMLREFLRVRVAFDPQADEPDCRQRDEGEDDGAKPDAI